MKNLIYASLGLFIVLSSVQAELVIIINKEVSINKMTKALLKDIYNNKTKIWNGGGRIVRTVLKKGSSHRLFCKLIKKKSSKLNRFWKKQIFTGKGLALHRFKKEADLLKYVAENKNAIGYVDSSLDTSFVKVFVLK